MLLSLIPNAKYANDRAFDCPGKAAIEQPRLKNLAQIQGFELFSYKNSFKPLLDLFMVSPSSSWAQSQEIIGSSLKKVEFEAISHKLDSTLCLLSVYKEEKQAAFISHIYIKAL